MKVFLGGTCNNSTWRDQLIPLLESNNINYYNPVVEDWTPDCIIEEERQKNDECNVHLYVITKEMKGVYSIAEAVESNFNNEKTTIFQIMPDKFDKGQMKSLKATVDLIERNNGFAYIGKDFDFILNILKKLKTKKIKLKKGFIIPAGTEFDLIPKGTKTTYYNSNFETFIETSEDSTAHFIINEDVINDNPDIFEVIE